jgi:hypothetical protein
MKLLPLGVLDQTGLSPDRLPSWELSALWFGLWGMGAVFAITFVVSLLLSCMKSKKAEKAFLIGIGISFLLLILWFLLYLIFDTSSVVGWKNGIVFVLTLIAMIVLLWTISLKAMCLIEECGTMRKLSIWALVAAWVFILAGSFRLMFVLLFKSV